MNKTTIWTFKYEPQTFDEMILDPVIKKKLAKAFQEVPNLLLVGPPGVGKGTFTNIFLRDTKLDAIRINCSDETSVDNIRSRVKSFATALGITDKKIVVLNECLEENEEILIDTLESNKKCLMKDLPKDTFKLPSYNIEKDIVEDDIAEIISDKNDDVFEIELEDGRKIKATKTHPFLVKRNNKKMFVELQNLTSDDEILCI